MHFTTTIASTLALILAVTTTASAQQPTPEACGACVYTAMVAASPTCDPTVFATTNPPSAMTPEEKACFCPLASDASASWLQSCIADGCAAADIMPMAEKLIAAKDELCADGSAPPPTTTASPATTAPPATTSAPIPPVTTSVKPVTTSVRPSNATSATPTPTKPVGKNGAAGGLLFGSSNKVVAGAALAIASVAALLF